MENRPQRKVVWCSLVDVNRDKAAIWKLKDINREVTGESVNEAAKQVVEVTNNTTSTMLVKMRLLGSSRFMIRNLDNKLPGESDIEQYKVLCYRSCLDILQVTWDVCLASKLLCLPMANCWLVLACSSKCKPSGYWSSRK